MYANAYQIKKMHIASQTKLADIGDALLRL